MSARDELANQLRQSLDLPAGETDGERAARLERYRFLLGQVGADTTGDETTLITRISYALGSPENEEPPTGVGA
jgi:hypothetical protein